MPNSYTANLNMTKPEVGADTDAWGGHLNDDLDTLDAIFKSDGTGTSVGINIGSGKTLAVAGTLTATGAASFSGTVTATGTLAATAATVNVTAGTTSIKDGSDATKVLKFDASGITTGTTRTLTAPDANGTIALTSNAGLLPPGSLVPYAGSSAPTGYLLCDGSAVSRTTYAALFAIIGTTYGVGDNSTTFNVPDLGGRTIAGKEATATRLTSVVSGVDGATLGSAGGTQSKTASTSITGTTSGTMSGTTGAPINGQASFVGGGAGTGVDQAHQHDVTVSGTLSVSGSGTSSAFSVVQPTIVLNYLIKT